jgi:hypothetical protein
MNIWSDLQTCVIRRRAVLAAIALFALIAPAASAHTSAVCALTEQDVRCIGTIANRPLTQGPAQAHMTVHNGYGRVSLLVAPMISRSVVPTSIKTNLACAQQPSGLTCIGIAKVLGRLVLITTAGSPRHGTVMITLGNAVVPPQQRVTRGVV